MNIGKAAEASGLPLKTIRYHETMFISCSSCSGPGASGFPSMNAATFFSLTVPLDPCRQRVNWPTAPMIVWMRLSLAHPSRPEINLFA